MVDKTAAPPAQMREWRVKRGMGQLRAVRAATGFVLFCAIFAATSPAHSAQMSPVRDISETFVSIVAPVTPRLIAAAYKPQASEVQSYPERPTPSQPAVPNAAAAEKRNSTHCPASATKRRSRIRAPNTFCIWFRICSAFLSSSSFCGSALPRKFAALPNEKLRIIGCKD